VGIFLEKCQMKVTLVSNESHIGCQMKVTLEGKLLSFINNLQIVCQMKVALEGDRGDR